MFDIEKNRCDYFIAYPCECKSHYKTASFMKSGEFIEALGKICKMFETDSITREYPLVGGIGFGSDLQDYYIYKVGRDTPQKIKWVGEASIATLIRDKEGAKGNSAFIVKKNMRLVRSMDVNIFFKKCMEKIESPGNNASEH